MKINSTQNYITNKNNHSSFKGTVTPEFVQYVECVREDCLKSKGTFSDLINNVCDNIISKAQRVMKNCFPEESVLSVDTTTGTQLDYITYSNNVLKKYVPCDYNAYYISKKETATPIFRLKRLHKAVISGCCFAGASVKDYAWAFFMTDYLESCNIRNPQFSKDCKDMFEFYYNKINLLKSETNADKHCRLKTQSEYAKLLDMVESVK